MNKFILLGADWCPVTKATKELFESIKKEEPNFNYEYIDIDSERGKELVNKFSVTDVPKTIFQDKIIFHGLPLKDELVRVFRRGNNKEEDDNKRPIGAGLMGGIIASLCCIGPLILIFLGIGGASTFLSISYRKPYFFLAGIVFVVISLWLYFRREKDGFCQECESPKARRRKMISAIILSLIIFVAVYIILVFILTPYLIPFVLK